MTCRTWHFGVAQLALLACALFPFLSPASGRSPAKAPPTLSASIRPRVSVHLRTGESAQIFEWRGDSAGISTAATTLPTTAATAVASVPWRQIIWDLTKSPPKEYSDDGKWHVTPSELAPGTRQMVSHGSGRLTLFWWLDYKTRRLGLFSKAKSPLSGFVASRPELSAGGSKYVYLASISGGEETLNTWDVVSGRIERLCAIRTDYPHWPVICSSAKALAYTEPRSFGYGLVVKSYQDDRVLFRSPEQQGSVVDYPSLSVIDRSLVYLTSNSGAFDLHKLRLPAGDDKIIAHVRGASARISVRSTNGDIAVDAQEPGRNHSIRIYRKDGKLKFQSPASLEAFTPSYSPDGRYIAFSTVARGNPLQEIIITGADALGAEGWTASD